jgi:hypothetical protein
VCQPALTQLKHATHAGRVGCTCNPDVVTQSHAGGCTLCELAWCCCARERVGLPIAAGMQRAGTEVGHFTWFTLVFDALTPL